MLTQREIDTWDARRLELKGRYISEGMTEEAADDRATKDVTREIREEMRDFASRAHGDPATVQVTANTLCDYADELERIANDPSGAGDPRLR